MCNEIAAVVFAIQALLIDVNADPKRVEDQLGEYSELATEIFYYAEVYGLDPYRMTTIGWHESKFGYRDPSMRANAPCDHEDHGHFADVVSERCPVEYAHSNHLACGPFQQIPKYAYPANEGDQVCSSFYDPRSATYHLAHAMMYIEGRWGSLSRQSSICHYCYGNVCTGDPDHGCYSYARYHMSQYGKIRELAQEYHSLPRKAQAEFVSRMLEENPRACTC